MEIRALKIFNSIKLILFLILVLGVITVLTACGDLVKESDAGACDSAIDARNYETAKSVCTSRKDKASAYMGMAGYDIVNLLKSSGTSTSTLTDPTGNLGDDDNIGAFILNILQLGVANIADNETRATKIAESKTNLDLASSKLQPYLIESEITDGKPPLETDEILLNSFAISFAMQLDQLILFDNKTTSTHSVPRPHTDNLTLLTCEPVSGYDSEASKAKLIKMDGHLWSTERNGMQCARVLNAYNAADNKTAAAAALATWVTNTSSGDNDSKLPAPFYDAVCPSFVSLTNYITDLTLNITELALPDNNTNTKAITDADNSTNELMRTIGCF